MGLTPFPQLSGTLQEYHKFLLLFCSSEFFRLVSTSTSVITLFKILSEIVLWNVLFVVSVSMSLKCGHASGCAWSWKYLVKSSI